MTTKQDWEKYRELTQEPLMEIRKHITMSMEYDIALLRITRHHNFGNQQSLTMRFLIKQEAERLGFWTDD